VLALRPNIIKLDMSLTRDIDRDPGRHALATALTTFGRTIGSQIVAEGVETQAELEALRRIGVAKVQGYLLGKPLPLAEAAVLPETGRFPQPRSRDTAVA
jgi:EAL domain-containing protein (putative c-di-GMP-specific phosphodiesterase class I)